MRIVVDAMGGDHAPFAAVQGAMDAVREQSGFTVILIGNQAELAPLLSHLSYPKDRIEILHTTERITNEDKPVKAAKEKKDSSMVVGAKMIKAGDGDVFLSAGNTGALMAVSLFNLGRIKGIDRPALSFFFPAKKGPVLVIDVGANTVCKPENYLQFGIMGSIYMQEMFRLDSPKVGLINVGTEDQKGNETLKQAFALLSDAKINFSGNVESRDIPYNVADVVVCDGFVGNVILKLSEGIAEFFVKSLKNIYQSNILTKISYLIVKKSFESFKKTIDYKEYGGVPLLGINGKVMKAHGSSNAKAFKNAILTAVRYGNSEVNQYIKKEFENMGGKKDGE